ncbi:MAG: hypothetical protein AVDCRST_MAG02-559, partial [uncultured Rubrobacteraceae bacterium]
AACGLFRRRLDGSSDRRSPPPRRLARREMRNPRRLLPSGRPSQGRRPRGGCRGGSAPDLRAGAL